MRKKVINGLLNLDLVIAGLSLVALVLLTFVGVIMRYFINKPIVWQEEVQIWMFLWIAFFGGSAAFRYKSHVEIEMIVEMFPKSVQKIIEFLIYAVVITVLIFLFLKGNLMVRQFIQTDKSTNVLSIPSSLIYSSIPVGCGLMILNYTIVTAKLFFGKNSAGEEEQTV